MFYAPFILLVALASLVTGTTTGLITFATTTDVPGWLQYIQSGGVIGMFIILFYALLTRKVVMGWTYDAMVTERDYYRNIAYKTTDISDRQVATAEEMLRRMDQIGRRNEALDQREKDSQLREQRREQDYRDFRGGRDE